MGSVEGYSSQTIKNSRKIDENWKSWSFPKIEDASINVWICLQYSRGRPKSHRKRVKVLDKHLRSTFDTFWYFRYFMCFRTVLCVLLVYGILYLFWLLLPKLCHSKIDIEDIRASKDTKQINDFIWNDWSVFVDLYEWS